MQNKVAVQARSAGPKPAMDKQTLTPVANHANGFVDARPEAAVQLRLQQMTANSRRNAVFDNARTTQRVRNDQPLQREIQAAPVQRAAVAEAAAPNKTGLPDNLKTGVENLSGLSLDDVRVHYNSPQPAQLQAHAFAQGKDIHVAPGQEAHLPHEAWHVVQQAQGRVKPTLQMKAGIPVNDDAGLEAEADAMGGEAVSAGAEASATQLAKWRADRHRQTTQLAPTSVFSALKPIQKRVKVGDIDYTVEYEKGLGPTAAAPALPVNATEAKAAAAIRRNRELDTAAMDAVVNPLMARLDGLVVGTDIHTQFLARDNHRMIREQLVKWIEDAAGKPGSHETFNRKNQYRIYDTELNLARGLLGWVLAKPGRKEEKRFANMVYQNASVAMHLNNLMKSVAARIEYLNLDSPQLNKIKQELSTDTPDVPDEKKNMSTYQTYFDEASKTNPKLKTEIGKNQLHVIRNPLLYQLRDKIVVLHDLMEYFMKPSWLPETAGRELLPEPDKDKQRSTTAVDGRGMRIDSSIKRGKLEIEQKNSNDNSHATRDENDATTQLARAYNIPIWAGQSFTAMRMFGMAQWVNATQAETTALAWGLFAFWRKDYDHTVPLAYHTLHEVMDIASNFGVAYTITNSPAQRQGGLEEQRLSSASTGLSMEEEAVLLRKHHDEMVSTYTAYKERLKKRLPYSRTDEKNKPDWIDAEDKVDACRQSFDVMIRRTPLDDDILARAAGILNEMRPSFEQLMRALKVIDQAKAPPGEEQGQLKLRHDNLMTNFYSYHEKNDPKNNDPTLPTKRATAQYSKLRDATRAKISALSIEFWKKVPDDQVLAGKYLAEMQKQFDELMAGTNAIAQSQRDILRLTTSHTKLMRDFDTMYKRFPLSEDEKKLDMPWTEKAREIRTLSIDFSSMVGSDTYQAGTILIKMDRILRDLSMDLDAYAEAHPNIPAARPL